MRAQPEQCPFLVPVAADWLWIYPVPAYCRRPEGKVRVPATDSLARLCLSNYAACSGYQARPAPRDGTLA